MKKITFQTILFLLFLTAIILLIPKVNKEYQIMAGGKTYQTDTFKILEEQGCVEFYENGLRKIKCNFSLK